MTTTPEPLDDLAAELLQEALIEQAVSGEAPAPPEPGKRRRAAPAEAAPDPEADEVLDFGPYCVECREDTTGMEDRTPAQMPGVEIVPGGAEDGGELVKSVLYKGWKCENCQPFEASIIEDTLVALAESTRRDQGEIRRIFRAQGVETIWANWIGPMLDEMETGLGLDQE